MQEDKIFQKLEQHDAQFVKIDERFVVVDNRLDRITDKLLEHDDRFDKLEKTMAEGFSKVNDNLEEIVTIVQRLDQERIFTVQWIRRIEDEVGEQKIKIQEHDVMLKKVKAELNIA
jgi:hypothetical protein